MQLCLDVPGPLGLVLKSYGRRRIEDLSLQPQLKPATILGQRHTLPNAVRQHTHVNLSGPEERVDGPPKMSPSLASVRVLWNRFAATLARLVPTISKPSSSPSLSCSLPTAMLLRLLLLAEVGVRFCPKEDARLIVYDENGDGGHDVLDVVVLLDEADAWRPLRDAEEVLRWLGVRACLDEGKGYCNARPLYQARAFRGVTGGVSAGDGVGGICSLSMDGLKSSFSCWMNVLTYSSSLLMMMGLMSSGSSLMKCLMSWTEGRLLSA